MPRSPTHLGPAGRALWKQLTDEYDFSAAELPLVAAACRQADDVALLEQVIRDEGAITTGSAGQPRLNAAITEARQGRLALARLLGELRIPIEDEAPMTARQRQAQRAARSRWDRDPIGRRHASAS